MQWWAGFSNMNSSKYKTERKIMDYSELSQDVKDFFISDYSNKASDLRIKAANPRSRKAAEYLEAASELEEIIANLKN